MDISLIPLCVVFVYQIKKNVYYREQYHAFLPVLRKKQTKKCFVNSMTTKTFSLVFHTHVDETIICLVDMKPNSTGIELFMFIIMNNKHTSSGAVLGLFLIRFLTLLWPSPSNIKTLLYLAHIRFIYDCYPHLVYQTPTNTNAQQNTSL